MTKESKTAIVVALAGLATGVFAVLIWPLIKKRFQQPSITLLMPTVKRTKTNAYTTSDVYND